MNNRRTRIFALVSFAVIGIMCASCSFKESKDAGEKAVAQFHDQFNNEKYQDIYSAADDRFKKASTQQEILDLFQAVHRKLGTVKNSSEAGWHVNSNTFETVVDLTYQTEFVEGKGVEQFVYSVKDGKATLLGYHINSPTLITK